MATKRRTDARQRTTFGNRFRLLARVLGLTGALAAPAGWVLAGDVLPAFPGWQPDQLETLVGPVRSLALGGSGTLAQVGTLLLGFGVVAVLVSVLFELVGGLFLVTGRKTVVGTNATVQTALAVALVVVVNAISFDAYRRFDLTRDAQFTLSNELTADLRKLRADSPTTVVVLQLHKTAGTLSDKADYYDAAAEAKVTEKILDLVDQLREFGPRFNVVVLDAQGRGYQRQLRDLTRTRPGLADAIAAAPENSIFFYAEGKVQRVARTTARGAVPDPADDAKSLTYPGAVARMSFNEFYQLDKTSTIAANDGKGNLVLIPRGKEAFVRKVLSVEERRPRVGLAVIHPLLTSREEDEPYTSAGMRRTLEANGFDVVDVILKKWGRGGPPTPAAFTYEETELDRVEGRYDLLTRAQGEYEGTLKGLTEFRKKVETIPLAELDRTFARQLGRRITTEADRDIIRRIVDANVEMRKEELVELNDALAKITPEYKERFRDERAVENRRVADVKAKLRQYVGDCDVLVVPRLTVLDISRGPEGIIPPSVFNVSPEQAEVVKDFLKAGKPVLFAVGPTNVDRGRTALPSGPDDVERLLPALGIELGRQTILTPEDAQGMAERQSEAFGASVAVPPLVFDLPDPVGKAPNPVTAAFRVTARAVDRKLDVKKSGYRPVYLTKAAADRLPFAAEVAFTSRESWNEANPLPDDDAVPKFDLAKPDDPKKGTRDEERRGPFPVGVAVETPVPAEWFDAAADPDVVPAYAALAGGAGATTKSPAGLAPHFALAAATPFGGDLYAACLTAAAEQTKRPTVRVVVLGHGGLFTGKELKPAEQTLLLHTLNWQLRRDERLPADAQEDAKWRYPRADLSAREFFVWRWATFAGLPAVVVYFGLIALMVRKVR